MASLDDALKAVAKDPPAGFVAIAVAAAQPPAKAIVVPLKGRSLLLPDWNGTEWAWYCDLALRVSTAQDAKNSEGVADKERATAKLVPLRDEMRAVGAGVVAPARAAVVYDAAVRVVLASNAAASGPTAGELAADAFKFGIVNAPATIAAALKFAFEGGLTNMTKVQGEAAKILGELFARPLAAVTGGLLAGLGPFGVIALAAGAYYLFGRRK